MSVYLEYNRFNERVAGWQLTECIYRPARIQGGHKHAPWELLQRVKQGDAIIHVRDIGGEPSIIGSSVAAGAATILRDGPKGEVFPHGVVRVPLRGFVAIRPTPSLKDIFLERQEELVSYLRKNKNMLIFGLHHERPILLSNIDFSTVDEDLQRILFYGENLTDVQTGERLTEISSRIGQEVFANRVKENYDNCCAFPECPVNDKSLLIAAHIARWADVPHLRGRLDNGISFCRNHDRAFEEGIFTIGLSGKIHAIEPTADLSTWVVQNILPAEGKKIRNGRVMPSKEACAFHWERHGFFHKKRKT
ncbi:MAG: hypothetical protein U1F40_15200 [Turneriella sp.]